MSQKSINSHPVNGYKDKGLKKSFYSIPHYYMPGLNTYSMNDISTSDEAIQHYSESDHFNLPVPCVKFFEIESKINAVLDLVNLKTKWKFENEKLLKLCKKKLSLNSLNDIKSIIQMNEASHLSTLKTMPFVLTQFTLNLMEDPDEHFDSEYNWYFKNTIEKFQSNGKWYLVFARGENLNILNIITISDNKFETIYNKRNKRFEGPIYDIKSSNSNDLMIRQKNKIFLFRDSFDIDTFLNNDSIYDNNSIPLADADISNNNFCTVDVKHVIKLWTDGKCIQNKYFEVENDQSDSFIHLSYLQDQTDVIAIIDRQKLYMIDTRIDISKPCSMYDPNIIIEQCEELTALKNSNLNSHSFYVASNHSVLTLDNRIGFAHKSYHMLSNPPSLITSHCYKNSLEPNEMLFLGNQIGEGFISSSYTSFQDDFLLCQNIMSSVPKPLDSLHKVRLQGHCLNPMLLDRLSLCLVGSTAFGENIEDLKLFSVNSVGDLFVQKLNDKTPINVAEFEKLVTVKTKKVLKLNYSNVFDMSKLWEKEPSNNCEEKINKNSVWSISKEKMTSYVDHLAPLILSPWDLDDLSEWEDEHVDTTHDLDCDYTAKISYWFNKNDSLLEPTNPLKTNMHSLHNFLTEATTSKAPTSENDNDSSSGYTVSLESNSSPTFF